MLHWSARPIRRGNFTYYRYVWKLFGIPIWFRDKYGKYEPLIDEEEARERMFDEAERNFYKYEGERMFGKKS